METQKKQLESRAQILFVNKDMINFEEVTRQRSLGWDKDEELGLNHSLNLVEGLPQQHSREPRL